MLFPIYVTVCVAVVFYVLLPMLAAHWNNRSWAGFRRRVRAVFNAPRFGYREAALLKDKGSLDGNYRLLGTIDAMEGRERLWVRGQGVSAVVDLSRAFLYVFNGRGIDAPLASKDRAGGLDKLRYRRVTSLSEGTKLFVAGRVASDEGKPIFVDAPGDRLVVISYDEPDEELEAAALASGRSRHPLLGPATYLCFALGLGIMLAYFIFSSTAETLITVRFMAYLVALSPLLAFAPPGIFLTFASNALGHRLLKLDIERDLRSMGDPPPCLPALQAHELASLDRRIAASRVGSLLLLLLAIVLNAVLAFVLYRFVF